MNLTTRIVVAVVVVIAALTVVGYVTEQKAKREIETRFQSATILGKNNLWSKILAIQFEKMETGSSALARDKALRDALLEGDFETISDNAASTYNLLSSSGVLSSLEIVDTESTTLFFKSNNKAGNTSARSQLAIQSLKHGKVKRGVEVGNSDKLMTVLAFPLFKRGTVVGAGIFRLSMQSALEDFKDNDSSEVAIAGKHKNFQYSTNELFWTGHKLALPQLGENSFVVQTWEAKTLSLVSLPIRNAEGQAVGHLLSANNFSNSYASQATTERNLLYITGFTFFVGIIIILWFVTRSLRPIDIMAKAADAISQGDFQQSITHHSSDEVGVLAKAFRHMIRELRTQHALVQEHEAALTLRNEKLRSLLDTVDQGFLTIDLEGCMGTERSAVVDTWFKPYSEVTSFVEYMSHFDEDFSAFFNIAWDEVASGIMPRTVTISQLPNSIHVGEKSYSVNYSPMGELEEMTACLIIIDDITEKLALEKGEREQREINQLVERMLRDKRSFHNFYEEVEDIVTSLREAQYEHQPNVLKRILHTLKGNTALFGLESIATHCHDLESALEEVSQLSPLVLPVPESTELFERWEVTKESLAIFIGDNSSDISLTEFDYQWLLSWHKRNNPQGPAFQRLIRYSLEEARWPLSVLAEQCKALAERVGKGHCQVEVQTSTVWLDPPQWRSFFSSLTHVIRNAVDHGLLPDSESDKQGKIVLSALTKDNSFIVSISDNGRGIDWQRVRDKALLAELPYESHEDLVQALLSDGVSTKEAVSELSGRGVGMAAVLDAVQSLDGSITVHSEVGKGTKWSFHFPSNKCVTGLSPSKLPRTDESEYLS